jgi:hypothetical protein
MRDIKFRAWDEKEKQMYYDIQDAYDGANDLPEDSFGLFLGRCNFARSPMSKYIVMQFTGVEDKKGAEIYEGDVVKNERGEAGKVVFAQGRFVSEYLPPHNWDPMEPCDGLLDRQEVIGNIYENSELLGET